MTQDMYQGLTSGLASLLDQKITKARLVNGKSIDGSCYARFDKGQKIEIACYETDDQRFSIKKIQYNEGAGMYRVFVFSPIQTADGKIILNHEGFSFSVEDGIVSSLNYLYGSETVRKNRKTVEEYASVSLDPGALALENKIHELLGKGKTQVNLKENIETYIPRIQQNVESLKKSRLSNFYPLDEEPKELYGQVSDWFSQLAGNGKRFDYLLEQDRWVYVFSIGKNTFQNLDFEEIFKYLELHYPKKQQNGKITDAALEAVFQKPPVNRAIILLESILDRVKGVDSYFLLSDGTRNYKGLVEFLSGTFPWETEGNLIKDSSSDTFMRTIEKEYSLGVDPIPADAIGAAFVGNDLMQVFLFHPTKKDKPPQLVYNEDKIRDAARFRLPDDWKNRLKNE